MYIGEENHRGWCILGRSQLPSCVFQLIYTDEDPILQRNVKNKRTLALSVVLSQGSHGRIIIIMFEQKKKLPPFFTQIFSVTWFSVGSCNRFFLLSMPRVWVRAADWKRSSTEFPEPQTLNWNSKPYFSCVYKMRIPRTQANVYICYAEKQRKSSFSKTLLTMWGKKAGRFRIKREFKWAIKRSPLFLEEETFVYVVWHILASVTSARLVLLIGGKKQLGFFNIPRSSFLISSNPGGLLLMNIPTNHLSTGFPWDWRPNSDMLLL